MGLSLSEAALIAELTRKIDALEGLAAEVAEMRQRFANHLDGEDVHEAVLGPADPLRMTGTVRRKAS